MAHIHMSRASCALVARTTQKKSHSDFVLTFAVFMFSVELCVCHSFNEQCITIGTRNARTMGVSKRPSSALYLHKSD